MSQDCPSARFCKFTTREENVVCYLSNNDMWHIYSLQLIIRFTLNLDKDQASKVPFI